MSGLFLGLSFLALIVGLGQDAGATTRSERWGKGWSDDDKDCQDTRAEILIKTSKDKIKFKRVSGLYDREDANQGNRAMPGKSFCNVTRGEWFDPYTGNIIRLANDLDVDHVVPLNHAWNAGASRWTKTRRRTFYNDWDNLILVGKSENRSKGDKGPLEYLPPRESFRCEYVQRWEFVKKKWGLAIPRPEAQKIAEVKSRHCNKIDR
ncbi:MAG: HNH endonuclease [Bdellovibrio sp.]|nr:HNH endonuclease [Bdellovibrio sp.]